MHSNGSVVYSYEWVVTERQDFDFPTTQRKLSQILYLVMKKYSLANLTIYRNSISLTFCLNVLFFDLSNFLFEINRNLRSFSVFQKANKYKANFRKIIELYGPFLYFFSLQWPRGHFIFFSISEVVFKK